MKGFKQISFAESVCKEFYGLVDTMSKESGVIMKNSQMLKLLMDTFKKGSQAV